MQLRKVHAMARCEDCGREWSNYKTATDLAAKHARETGHAVRGEVGYAMAWGPGAEAGKENR